MSGELQTVVDAEGNIVGRVPLHFGATEGGVVMAGALEYQTERGDRGVVMIGQITHMIERGAPQRTLIYLTNGVKLRSRTGMDALREKINSMAVYIAIQQAQACHFGNLEMDPT